MIFHVYQDELFPGNHFWCFNSLKLNFVDFQIIFGNGGNAISRQVKNRRDIEQTMIDELMNMSSQEHPMKFVESLILSDEAPSLLCVI